jgi:hypothetical protein
VVAGESGEAGNPGTLGMTKERAIVPVRVVAGPRRFSSPWVGRFGPATTLYGIVTLSFVIPSEAEGSAVPRTFPGNAGFSPQKKLSSRPERRDLRFPFFIASPIQP